jgi:FMN phosphatase YigB (HAD superfamily)
MKILLDYNRTIFDPETDMLYPGVFDILRRLSVRHELFLISRDEPSRKERMEELDIRQYFQKILFVKEKSKQIFSEITDDAKDVIVVGDSIGDEIKVGNQLGFITVRLKKGMFATAIPKDADEVAKFELSDINELEKIISFYEK